MSGLVVWLTGLPSSGKTTLAEATAAQLRPVQPVAVLDGDAMRAALKPPPGYDPAARDAFYETLGNVAALLARQGLTVLVPATAHLRAYRERARRAAPGFLEVFVDTPLDECRRRDAKGLFARGELALPGTAQAPYEPPLHPELVARFGDEGSAERLAALVRSTLIDSSVKFH